MELHAFLDYLNQGNTVVSGSEYSLMMHKLSQEALQITAELNNSYHTPEEICEIFSRLTGKQVRAHFPCSRRSTRTAERTSGSAKVYSSTVAAAFRIRATFSQQLVRIGEERRRCPACRNTKGGYALWIT